MPLFCKWYAQRLACSADLLFSTHRFELQHIISSATITGTDLPLSHFFFRLAHHQACQDEFPAHFHPITASFLAAPLWKILHICHKGSRPLQEPFLLAVTGTFHNVAAQPAAVCQLQTSHVHRYMLWVPALDISDYICSAWLFHRHCCWCECSFSLTNASMIHNF